MQSRSLKALALAVLACAIVAGPASAAPTWAPASSAAIHPGVQTLTDGAQCTANFVFYDASNTIYIGQAAGEIPSGDLLVDRVSLHMLVEVRGHLCAEAVAPAALLASAV